MSYLTKTVNALVVLEVYAYAVTVYCYKVRLSHSDSVSNSCEESNRF
jgi:hypothetical protein